MNNTSTVVNEINIVGNNNTDMMTFTGIVEELDGDYLIVTKEIRSIDDKGNLTCTNYGNKMIFRIRAVQFLYGQNDRLLRSEFVLIADGIVGKKVQVTFTEANYPKLVEIFPL
jgi:hypothetical protein